jgi:hypothetical protein
MMPFLFWASLNYARQQNRLAWLLLILAVVGIILGGNPQNLILTCLGASAFFSTVLVTEKQHRHYQPWLYYFLAYVLATGICSVYGLSFYELYSLAAKYHTNWGVSAFPAQALLGLVFPIFVFIPTLGVKFLPYLGMLTFATLIGGTRLSGKFRAVTIFFLATTLLLLLKIVGFPGINWLGYLPTLNEILFTKYTAVLYFSLSILFGLSIQELLAHDRRRRFFVGLALTVILMVVFYFQLDRAYRHASHLRYAVGGLLVFGVGVWALLCTVTHVRGANPRKCLVAAIVTGLLAELFLLCRVYPLHEEGLDYGAISQAPEFVTFLRQDRQHAYDRLFGVGTLLMGNLASTYGLHDIRGLSATSVARYYQFMHQLVLGEEPGRRPSAPTTSTQYHPRARPILNLLGVNYIIFDDCKTHDLPHTRLIYEKSCVKIYRNLDAYPRAFVRHDYKVFSQRAEVLAAMKDGTENLTTTALLVQKPDVEAVTASAPPSKTPPAPAHITRYDANAVHLTVTLQHPGILTLSDLIFPGWNVYVDHKPHALLTVDYLLRGVALPIGQHDVRFVYQPDWLRYGSLTSGVFLLLTALIARVHGRNARKKNCLASHPDRNLGEI